MRKVHKMMSLPDTLPVYKCRCDYEGTDMMHLIKVIVLFIFFTLNPLFCANYAQCNKLYTDIKCIFF